MKQKLFNFLNYNSHFITFINGLIILNVAVIILESYQHIDAYHGDFFYYFEIVSVAIFSLEYILRIWTADCDPRYEGHPLRSRLMFMVSAMGIIDLLAVLPFYIPFLFDVDLRVILVLRTTRLLRIFKLGRYSKSLIMIKRVLAETKADLTMALVTAFVLLTVSSTLMYYVEGHVQPDKFANIGQSFWWAIATLTTVGYGDVYPITNAGKVISGIIAVIGIGFVALPTAIISSKFIQELQSTRSQKECECPRCGHTFKTG